MIKLNFPSYIIHLINSYLSDRTFQVKILATLSRIGTVSAGSPQGSNLSPMLYNIYTHDFPTTPAVDVCLFVDDAAIIAQACNPDMVRRYLQQYLKKLQSWLRKWRIKINVGKSQAIIFKKVHSDGEKTHWWCVGAPCKEYVTRGEFSGGAGNPAPKEFPTSYS
ncbi:RNA-directed DNA polymerase from mobile element jockey [Trichonephila clavipes]|nr:RNA-directed DNA polymerase from mobile element jockey [Trichonephila clavipes]